MITGANRQKENANRNINFLQRLKEQKMKKNLLVASILFVAVTSALAGERHQLNNGNGASATGVGIGVGAGGAGGIGTGTGTGGGADIRNPLQIPPAASANSPNVTLVGCPPIVVGVEAHQNWFFGNSGTKEDEIVLVSFCGALAVGDIETARQILCNAKPDYRAADAQTGTPQCKVQQE